MSEAGEWIVVPARKEFLSAPGFGHVLSLRADDAASVTYQESQFK
jgi:hypothetical protein